MIYVLSVLVILGAAFGPGLLARVREKLEKS